MKKLIIFLLRLKLGLKIGEQFQFANQHSENDYYFFTDSALMKKHISKRGRDYITPSGVGLNWLLSEDCEIRKAGAAE